jgi:serine/threonine protein phosphatase 1
MTRYAITDIHGCLETFQVLLKNIDLQPEDELYLLGDYIDRGPECKNVVRLIQEMQKSGRKMVCLRGNHEQLAIEHSDYSRQYNYWSPQELDWFETLPHYHLLEDYVLVHAGLNFKAVDPLWDKKAMLWERYWEDNIDLQWLAGRTILHGHTPRRYTTLRQDIEIGTPSLDLDTGCAHISQGLGYLTAFNLDTREATSLRRIDEVK